MTIAVLVNEGKNDIHEIDLDISPEKNEIYKICYSFLSPSLKS